MRGRSLALSILLVAGGVAACGDDDGGADAQPFIDALSEELQADEDAPLTEDEADCVAEGSVEAMGVDFLVENDITPEQLAEAEGPQDLDVEVSEEQARNTAEALFSCDIDIAASMLPADASDEAVACVEDNLDIDVFVDALTAEYLGNPEESQELFAPVFEALDAECGDFVSG